MVSLDLACHGMPDEAIDFGIMHRVLSELLHRCSKMDGLIGARLVAHGSGKPTRMQTPDSAIGT